ncbi:MAG TPA: hypothetical protein PK385_12730 [Spirochaetota bacterium]|nr:hypothetical protein [Spirochaetota bacterium]HOS33673.1 hypothetical protein [Spirochaetota bacterium]HOS33676.1 hypothetical protein [Spirochaetota bacterium]HOS56908.1 hypothetical protein [Spirochaetota bacterium]HPK62711.1 hypothetical protein [Spirochaetota bacterium]
MTLIFQEMEALLSGWKDSANVTEFQSKYWPRDKQLKHEYLGNSDENSLKLLKEDGWDGEIVGSVTSQTARNYFCSLNRDAQEIILPPDRDIIRISCFFGLSFIRANILILKAQFEKYCSVLGDRRGIEGYEDSANILCELIDNYNLCKELATNFNPGMNKRLPEDKLFEIFEEHNNWATKEKYDYDKYKLLLQTMIITGIFLYPINGPEVNKFELNQNKEVEILSKANKSLEEEFWIKKLEYIQIQRDLENELYELENYRLRNKNIEAKFLKKYGELFYNLKSIKVERDIITLMIEIKQAAPEITLSESREKLQEKIQSLDTNLQDIRHNVAISWYIDNNPFVTAVDSTEFEENKKEIKNLLRETWKLTHPDKLNKLSFSKKQKEKLRGLYEESVKIRDVEIGATVISKNKLIDILNSIKDIYKAMGLDIIDEMSIQGDTIEEQMIWLEEKIKNIEKDISKIKNERLLLNQDKVIKEYSAIINNDETGKKFEEDANEQIKILTLEIEELKKQYEKLYGVKYEKDQRD